MKRKQLKKRNFKIHNGMLFILVITLLGIFTFNVANNFQTKKNSSQNGNISVSRTKKSESSDLCSFTLAIPENYRKQQPTNSFYGITLKDGQGTVCDVLLGPNYNNQYEGFTGEQVQINAYASSQTNIKEILFADSAKNIKEKDFYTRYTRPSYGGEDEVMLIKKENIIYQLIWRNNTDTNNLEDTAIKIANELKPN